MTIPKQLDRQIPCKSKVLRGSVTHPEGVQTKSGRDLGSKMFKNVELSSRWRGGVTTFQPKSVENVELSAKMPLGKEIGGTRQGFSLLLST